MSDPFDSLRCPEGRTEPSPEFRAQLMARVRSELNIPDVNLASDGGTQLSTNPELAVLVNPLARRARFRPLVIAAAAAAATLVVALVVVSNDRGADVQIDTPDTTFVEPATASSTTVPVPTTTSSVDPGALLPAPRALEEIGAVAATMKSRPLVVAASGDTVAVVGDTGSVDLFDAKDGTPRASVPAPTPTGYLAAAVPAFGSVWVGVQSLTPGAPDAVIRVDVQTGTVLASIPVPQLLQTSADAGFSALINRTSGSDADDRGVWFLTKAPSAMVRIDPQTNTIAEAVPSPAGGIGVRFGFDSAWVATSDGILHRLDRASGAEHSRIDLKGEPKTLQILDGQVWVMARSDSLKSVVHRVDPATNALVASIVVAESQSALELGGLASFEGRLWVHPTNGAQLVEIDIATNTVVARYGPASGGGDVTVSGSGLWVTSTGGRTVYRIPARPR